VIEKAGGQRLQRLIRTRILQPLALHDTTFPTRPGIAGYHAHGYLATARNGGRLVDITEWSPSLAWAAGAMVSTADDLSRFYAALLGGRLLPARLLAEMTTTVPAGERAGYGLGLIRQGGRCGTRWGHNGSVPGYVTVASADRTGRRTAVVMMSVQPNPVLAPVLRRTIDVATCEASSLARAAAA
jgi:D-alanyl-D-alanine carboxypeptidase